MVYGASEVNFKEKKVSKLTKTSCNSSCSSRSITLQWRRRGLRLPAGLSPGHSHSTTISSFDNPRFPCDSFLVLLVHPLIGFGHPERRGTRCNPIKTVSMQACAYRHARKFRITRFSLPSKIKNTQTFVVMNLHRFDESCSSNENRYRLI